MIKRKGETWTTVQCQKCKDCFKVLNDRHLVVMKCPYCNSDVQGKVYKEWAEGAQGALKPTKISCAAKIHTIKED